MSCVERLDLTIIQGATFSRSLNWYGGGKVCHLIEALTPGCPTAIQITGHGLPSISDTPIEIKHVKGATRANTNPDTGERFLATYVDVDNFTVDVDTVGQTYTTGTGLVTYYEPKDLTGWSARMQVREEREDVTPILDLTSPGDITIRIADARITITIDAVTTAALDFDTAVYDLELIDGSGAVTRLIEGEVELCREVTR